MSVEAWGALLALAAFMYGAAVGSFLNVCIWRIPRDESIIHPRSHCPQCGKTIAWFDNIPLLSWLLLGARCRHCSTRISVCYPLVELLTALLFLGLWLKYGFDGRTLVYWMVAGGLVLGSGVDLKFYILPDRVTLGGIIAGLILSPLVPKLHGETTAIAGLTASAIGAAVGFFGLWAVAWAGEKLLKKEAMGFGDVKLMGAVGALMGWSGVIFTVTISSLIGSIIGVTLILIGRRKWQSRLPYGPFIAAAALLWTLGGRDLFMAYLRWVAGVEVLP